MLMGWYKLKHETTKTEPFSYRNTIVSGDIAVGRDVIITMGINR